MKSEPLFTDLCQAFEEAADHRQPAPERRFHKHDQYLSYDLKAPVLWGIMKKFKPRILALSLRDRLDLAAELLAQHIGELGHAGIYIVALGVKELTPAHNNYFDRIADDFRSWSHVDHFCSDVLQPLLEIQAAATLALVRQWNSSPNRWKRRASVVTFTRSAGASGAYTDEALRLCDNLIWDPEDIVQKGVGWALKDNMRGAPERIITYVKDLRRQGVPSTITLYAIRDLKGEQRQEVMAVKKSGVESAGF